MGLLVQQDIQQIAGEPGEDEEQPAESITKQLTEKMDHQAADEAVAGKMHQIGMQGERCDQAPPFTVVKDGGAIDSPSGKPSALR